MEDFVSIVLVFENPSVKTCKQYNNTGEAESIETVQSLIEILIQLPTEFSGRGKEVKALENFQISS